MSVPFLRSQLSAPRQPRGTATLSDRLIRQCNRIDSYGLDTAQHFRPVAPNGVQPNGQPDWTDRRVWPRRARPNALGFWAIGEAPKACSPPASEPAQQALDIVELQGWPGCLTEAAPQLLKDLARTLRIDLVRYFDRGPEIRTLGPLRTPERITRRISGLTHAEARRHLPQHLLGHGLRALPHLLQRPRLVPRRALEVALF